MFKNVEVFEGQTVIDIVIQEYGCYEGIFLFLVDNPTLSLTTDLKVKQLVNIRVEVPELTDMNKRIINEYRLLGVSVNSNYEKAGSNGYVQQGYVEPGYVM